MRKYLILFIQIIFVSVNPLSQSWAESEKDSKHQHKQEDHPHEDEQEESAHKDHKETDEHADHKGEEAHDDHGHGEHEEEASPTVGPTKGITEFNEENGLKLSPEAQKSFELQYAVLKAAPFKIKKTAVIYTLEDKSVFRLRNGFYKRIDVQLIHQNEIEATISSKDLKPGDQIVITGVGFLRVAEIAASGGAPEGHSH